MFAKFAFNLEIIKTLEEFLLNCWDWSGAKQCRSCKISKKYSLRAISRLHGNKRIYMHYILEKQIYIMSCNLQAKVWTFAAFRPSALCALRPQPLEPRVGPSGSAGPLLHRRTLLSEFITLGICTSCSSRVAVQSYRIARSSWIWRLV